MDTTIATANALHRLLRQSLLVARPMPVAANEPTLGPLPADAAETLPMLYRSEAFAEDLLDILPLAVR